MKYAMRKSIVAVIVLLTLGLEGRVLLTQLYNEKQEARQQEYLDCLSRNLGLDEASGLPYFQAIHLFYDGGRDFQSATPFGQHIRHFYQQAIAEGRLVIHPIIGRTTYEQMFEFAAQHMPAGEVICLANADIFFDSTLALVDNIAENELYALGRHEVAVLNEWHQAPLSEVPHTSQDLWVWRNPLNIQVRIMDNKDNILKPVELGQWGCDVSLNYQAEQQGINVLNPCGSIRIYHWHKSAVRNYSMDDTFGNEECWRQAIPFSWRLSSRN